MFTELSIIIVNWNLKDDTIECIESLLRARASPRQLVIVDNGSTDGSITAIKQNYGNSINIIEAEQNRGYGTGVNLGIKYSLNQNFKWFLLLNNDTIVAEDFIERLQRATQDSKEYSILTPLILYYNNPTTIWYLGNRLISKTLLTIDNYKNRQVDQNLPQVIPIDFANGCAMMINRNIFEQIGFLDEFLFMYGEEVDFCWRARLAGFKFACITSARIWHKISKSSQNDQPLARYLRIRNQIYFYQRYSHGMQKPAYILFTLFRTTYLCSFDLFKRRTSLFRPSLNGWLDGWFKKSVSKSGY
jgi:hypothetical protein